MADKFNTENLSSEELAKHLKKPSGDAGKKVGVQMNKGNKYICLNSYKVLKPQDNNSILEIGMGNGFFIKDLLSMAKNLTYVGADFSEIMVTEAREINKGFTNVSFYEASIEKLPFKNEQFDLITTTNTVYFWPNLIENLKELRRVLKPNGKLLIGYRDKDFMDKVEFTNHGFNKYKCEDIEMLLSGNGFDQLDTHKISEPKLEFEGNTIVMHGMYTVGIKKE